MRGVVMHLGRDKVFIEETSLGFLWQPSLNAASGIVIGVMLSAVLWGLIFAVAWFLAR